MSARNVMQMDRESIAEFQKDIYIGTKDEPFVDSWLSYNLQKRSPAPKFKSKMIKTPKGESENNFQNVTYTVDNKFDTLSILEGHINLFPIKVKDDYAKTISIRYPHYPGHNIFVESELNIDKERKQIIDSKYMDMYYQYFVTKKRTYGRMVGEQECLTDWGTELPGLPLIVPLPFFFSKHPRKSLPILKGDNQIEFDCKLNIKLSSLLEMLMKVETKNEDGEVETIYKRIPCNINYLECKSDEIPIPELWGYYSEMSDGERNWKRSMDEKTKEPLKQTIYYEDVHMIMSDNPTPMGSKVSVKLESEHPAKHIFWVAQLESGSMSNYTTSEEDLNGWNPCAKSGLKYGGSKRIPEASHMHFENSEPYHFFPAEPSDPGYNCFTYQYKPSQIQSADNAVILVKCGASLEVVLGDTDPFSKPEEEREYRDGEGNLLPKEAIEHIEDNSNKPKYDIHVRVVMEKKMDVFWDEKKNKLSFV